MQLVKATESNYGVINKLLILSSNNNEMGYAYPRGDIEDVENELEQYGFSVNDCFYMIKDQEDIIGIIGFLEIDNDAAIIIGPVMYKNFYLSQNVSESILILLSIINNKFKKISFDVLKENDILVNVLEKNNFKLVSSSMTMKLHLEHKIFKSDNNFRKIRLVHLVDKNRLIEIDNLFHHTLIDWADESVNTLFDYLDEGYQIAVAIKDNQVIGTIIWIWFDRLGYGRIEYLAIQENHQKKGWGGLLIDYVLSKLSESVKNELHNYLYLDFNEKNENAYKLYLKKGFNMEYQDYIYRLELGE